MNQVRKFRLGEVLVQQGLLSLHQLEQALAEQKRTGRKLGRVLSDMNLVTDQAIGLTIAEQMKLPFLDLARRELSPELVMRLPESLARRHRALVIGQQDDGLLVAFSDPMDTFAQDEVARALHSTIHPVVVTEKSLMDVVDRIYQRREQVSGLADEVAADLGPAVASLDMLAGTEDAPIVKLIASIFETAVAQAVSDIHIEPQERQTIIRFRIDGVLHQHSTYDPKVSTALIQRLKLMSNLDISEKRLPQDGRFQTAINNSPIDIRISTLPTQYGESVVMRLLIQSNQKASLDALKMPQAILSRLKLALSAPSGLILVTGPTGSGKTTTLYAALAELNDSETKIITVEDPVEYRLPGLNQVQVHDKIDLTFARVLRACLRQDPDVLLVGEMRDQETAEIGLRAAMTGHLVVSTLHTNDAAGAVLRLADMGVPPYMSALGLRLVLAQRLVRVVCDSCRMPYEPAAHEIEWLDKDLADMRGDDGAPMQKGTFFKGVGCNNCHQTGYRGRTGIYEMIEMTPEMTHAASQGDHITFNQIAQKQFANYTLKRDAIRLVLSGRTTVAEAMRASTPI
ncbi:GspE/PulE family protein [Aquabacterium sp.]|uniref:GspE/PulE family protein n=1 Tax=Aquabacterium sp. TaxID=1872578 RepID=UPI002E32E02E|nr:ATPase, T2SS/T4P/T4SS family [Aquabacterium sp.]HEX5311628.1 ATPase, T2SS/T4P/T4SS family [Aquabacterium sp.]